MTDAFTDRELLSDPADNFFSVTPSDGSDLAIVPRGLYVGGAGDLVVHDRSGTAVTFVGVPAGSVLPIRAFRVLATGTTATSIVGLH